MTRCAPVSATSSRRAGGAHVCLLLLAPIPWAARSWALPFLTALAPAARYNHAHRRRHKALTDWARQLLLVVRRWWPDRQLVAVADRTDAALEFLAAGQSWAPPVTVVRRLRLDAALETPAPPRQPHQRGRPRRKGPRLPTVAAVAADRQTDGTPVTVATWSGRGERTVAVVSATAVWHHPGRPPAPRRWLLLRDPAGTFATPALRCTDRAVSPEQILAWLVLRWQLAVTFAETRRHRGVETQRQWSDLAIERTTPARLGLCSLVTLLAQPQIVTADHVRQAAW